MKHQYICAGCEATLQFLHEMLYTFLVGLSFKLYSLKFFGKIVTKGNAVQIFSNFPAKRLSIYRKKNVVTPFN